MGDASLSPAIESIPSVGAPATLRPELSELVDTIVRETIEPASHGVDLRAAFPDEGLHALRAARLMSAAVPQRFGGRGLGLEALSDVAQRLARGCGSTAMIWAMHQVQLACLTAAAEVSSEFADLLRDLVEDEALIASITSEAGVGGELRRSITAVEATDADEVTLEKHAPTISYAEQADAYLITARRSSDSAGDDQVIAVVLRNQAKLERRSTWDALGMRGIISPGYGFTATFESTQILPIPFGIVASRILVPWSHILWSSCWYGLALEAYARARGIELRRRGSSKQSPDLRLAETGRGLSLLKASLHEAIEHLVPGAESTGLLETVRLNDLKVSASRIAFDAATKSLEICGMSGYQERTGQSIARILRDLLSARLMIGNERILGMNALMAPPRVV